MCPAGALFSLDNLGKWWATLEYQRVTFCLVALTDVSRKFRLRDTSGRKGLIDATDCGREGSSPPRYHREHLRGRQAEQAKDD